MIYTGIGKIIIKGNEYEAFIELNPEDAEILTRIPQNSDLVNSAKLTLFSIQTILTVMGQLNTKIMKCLICDSDETSQTSAHIFPAWMIASAFDHANRTRDHEIIYAMYPLDSKLPYFGNSVLPDKINEQIGRDLTDEEIQQQENFLTVNNLWCVGCERRIKQIEDYFLENVERQITDFSKCNDTEIVELSNANNFLIRLFFYSVFYRAHLSNFMGFTLNYKTAKKIKFFLNNYIKDNLSNTIDSIDTSNRKDQILKLPIRCMKIEEKEKNIQVLYMSIINMTNRIVL